MLCQFAVRNAVHGWFSLTFAPAGALAATGARVVEYSQAGAGYAVAIQSEDDALTLERSHIVLALEGRRPVLEVNLTAARKAGLDISARLLKLARKVI